VPLSDPFAKRYEAQIQETVKAVAKNFPGINSELVYQSRSGRPTDPWLEPDICDAIEIAAKENIKHVIIQPVGFICDHIEVLFDLDVEAKETCEKYQLGFYRASTVGTHPAFIRALKEAIQEQITNGI
jgi:ferrochelatase